MLWATSDIFFIPLLKFCRFLVFLYLGGADMTEISVAFRNFVSAPSRFKQKFVRSYRNRSGHVGDLTTSVRQKLRSHSCRLHSLSHMLTSLLSSHFPKYYPELDHQLFLPSPFQFICCPTNRWSVMLLDTHIVLQSLKFWRHLTKEWSYGVAGDPYLYNSLCAIALIIIIITYLIVLIMLVTKWVIHDPRLCYLSWLSDCLSKFKCTKYLC